jgi:anthranilate synthase/aminodeoxychorismate synthase-like glutamine amidotransferase
MKALLIDAYDSFIYIIDQYLSTLDVDTRVVRNDQVSFGFVETLSPDLIVLGPGPGHPSDAGYVELIQRFQGKYPLLGVCLGHQAIGLAYGATVSRASHLVHGKTSVVRHDQRGCFRGQPNPFRATRYHSLIVEEHGMPDCLEVVARSEDDGYVMGLRHRIHPIESVQFHPESVCTEHGILLFANFITTYVLPRQPRPAICDRSVTAG